MQQWLVFAIPNIQVQNFKAIGKSFKHLAQLLVIFKVLKCSLFVSVNIIKVRSSVRKGSAHIQYDSDYTYYNSTDIWIRLHADDSPSHQGLHSVKESEAPIRNFSGDGQRFMPFVQVVQDLVDFGG